MRIRITQFVLFLLLAALPLVAQDNSTSVFGEEKEPNISEAKDDKTAEAEAKRTASALQFLRESITEVSLLRTTENRISFSAELAGLMWYHDPAEARRMFDGITDSFVGLLADYSARANAAARAAGGYPGRSSIGGRPQESIKLYKAFSVRQGIALSIAEHDPETAFAFVYRTSNIVTAKPFSDRIQEQDRRLLSMIIDRMSVEDVDKALALGRELLKGGFNPAVLGLLEKIANKDETVGKVFAADVIASATRALGSTEFRLYELGVVLEVGSERLRRVKAGSAKRVLFSESSIRQYAEQFGNALLRQDDIGAYSLKKYADLIRPFASGVAGRIEAKAKQASRGRDGDDAVLTRAAELAQRAEDAAKAAAPPPPMAMSAEQGSIAAGDVEKLSPMDELMRQIAAGENIKLSDDERRDFVLQAQSIIAELDDPGAKIVALSALASQIASIGDRELASSIMNEARMLVTSQPKNYLDFMQVWMLVGGYSEVEPDEAFILLEDTIFRLNDTIWALVKVAEFMDTGGELVEDGEIQIGAFGGGMIRDLLRSLQGSDQVISRMAESDFDRTKALAEKFDRPEARILARMMILRSVLGKGK